MGLGKSFKLFRSFNKAFTLNIFCSVLENDSWTIEKFYQYVEHVSSIGSSSKVLKCRCNSKILFDFLPQLEVAASSGHVILKPKYIVRNKSNSFSCGVNRDSSIGYK